MIPLEVVQNASKDIMFRIKHVLPSPPPIWLINVLSIKMTLFVMNVKKTIITMTVSVFKFRRKLKDVKNTGLSMHYNVSPVRMDI